MFLYHTIALQTHTSHKVSTVGVCNAAAVLLWNYWVCVGAAFQLLGLAAQVLFACLIAWRQKLQDLS
jgi:hypothetical protein